MERGKVASAAATAARTASRSPTDAARLRPDLPCTSLAHARGRANQRAANVGEGRVGLGGVFVAGHACMHAKSHHPHKNAQKKDTKRPRCTRTRTHAGATPKLDDRKLATQTQTHTDTHTPEGTAGGRRGRNLNSDVGKFAFPGACGQHARRLQRGHLVRRSPSPLHSNACACVALWRHASEPALVHELMLRSTAFPTTKRKTSPRLACDCKRSRTASSVRTLARAARSVRIALTLLQRAA